MKQFWIKILILNTIVGFASIKTLHAQSSRLFEKVEELLDNQASVLVQQRYMEAEKMEYQTGIFPENPQVEFEYLRPNPRLRDQALNYKISQEFEFPTVYGSRKKLAHAKQGKADIQLSQYKVEFLKQTLLTWSDWMFLNKKAAFLKNQSELAKKIKESTEKLFSAGQINVLERNKAQVFYLNIEKQYQETLQEKLIKENSLKQFNQGEKFSFLEEVYPVPYFENFASQEGFSSENTNLELHLMNQNIELSKLEINLAKAENLPEFEIGYIREQDIEVDFKGVSLGLSIPLWKNKNKVKAQRLKLQAYEQDKELRTNLIQIEIENRILSQKLKQDYFQNLENSLNQSDNMQLVEKAFQLGEITVIDYITEQNLYNDLYEKYLETEWELSLNWIELYCLLYRN